MSTNFSSSSPIDGITLWSGLESTSSEIDGVMRRATTAGPNWRKTPLQERIQIACTYRDKLTSNRAEIEDLISREVGKLPWEAAGEVDASIAKIELSIQALMQRRYDAPASELSQISRRTLYRAVGVAIVIGPFNFPLHLPGGQIVPALLAGNTVVFKPSEQATAIGHWMTDAWQSAGLPQDVLQLIVGGPEVAKQAIDSRYTSAVFLTGSRSAGCSIHQRLAGRTDVLLALELGGNNPIVVTPDVSEETVGSIVSSSAFVTAGQRCTCARRAIFIESESTESQIQRLVQRARQLRIGMPYDKPQPHIGPLISKRAADVLLATYEKLLGLGCQPIIPLEIEPRAGNLVRPTIVDASMVSADQWTQIGQMEWFGPLLVVRRVVDFDDAIQAAADTPYGLAAALLGGTQKMFDKFVSSIHAGIVNWNGTTTGAAGALPFGGLGDSGNHRPVGFHAIDACNDPIAIIEQPEPSKHDPWSVVE